jgi:hypothetical protein
MHSSGGKRKPGRSNILLYSGQLHGMPYILSSLNRHCLFSLFSLFSRLKSCIRRYFFLPSLRCDTRRLNHPHLFPHPQTSPHLISSHFISFHLIFSPLLFSSLLPPSLTLLPSPSPSPTRFSCPHALFLQYLLFIAPSRRALVPNPSPRHPIVARIRPLCMFLLSCPNQLSCR